MYRPNNIKCVCGYDTGLNANGFLMVIPPDGLRCPHCGKVIIGGNKPDIPHKPWKPWTFPRPQPDIPKPAPWKPEDYWYKDDDVKYRVDMNKPPLLSCG